MKKDKQVQSAERFLDSGELGSSTLIDVANACSELIRTESEKSSIRAIQLGVKFINRVRRSNPEIRQVAHRALGWVYLVHGKFNKSKDEYLKARYLVRRNPLERGRIDRILVDVYMYLGEFAQARQRARQAMKTFARLKNDEELIKTRVHYANLLHRQDQHKEAQLLYREAAEHFQKTGNHLIAAFCNHNQANTLVQLFRLHEAEKMYRHAERVFIAHGYNLRANGCRYGLAWLHLLQGKFHIALKELADCEAEYTKASQPREVVLCQLDRAEAYLGLNLYSDAHRAAAQAEKKAQKLGLRYETAKAALFYAKASLALGNSSKAIRALRRAEKGFKREHNEPFLGVVELASIQTGRNVMDRERKIRTARRRFSRAQLPLWEAICEFQVLSEYPEDKSILRRLRKNAAVRAVPHLFARWQTFEGDRLARQGNIAGAIKRWQKACKVLDAVRAKLPPVDLRTSFLKDQGDPYCRLIETELSNDTVLAAAWSERYKTSGLWQYDKTFLTENPARKKAEQSLEELAAQVTAYSGRLESTVRGSSSARRVMKEAFSNLQEKVRENLTALEVSANADERSIENTLRIISSVAKRRYVIQFHAGKNDLVAFIHHNNLTRFHRYTNGTGIVRELMARWRFHVERMPYLSSPESSKNLQAEKALLRQIGDWLIAPLELSKNQRRILIVPEGDTENLPWQAIIYDNQYLANRFEIILSPSLLHYLNACNNETRSKRIEVFIGNTQGLDNIQNEVDILKRAGDFNTTIHDPGFRHDWPNESKARLWHFIGHAIFRSDNPFYSSLLMNDGAFFAADFRLRRNTVNLITLAGCRTGQQTAVPGEETVGLNRSLLEMGARNVLASQWAVYNDATVEWMGEFYSRFLRGESIPSAVRLTSMKLQNRYPSAYQWGSYILHGAG